MILKFITRNSWRLFKCTTIPNNPSNFLVAIKAFKKISVGICGDAKASAEAMLHGLEGASLASDKNKEQPNSISYC